MSTIVATPAAPVPSRLRAEPCGATILLYHRVAEPGLDPQLLCVTPARFAEHMEVLRRECYPLSLGALVAGLREGLVPAHAVVVTFDDGYADNYTQALLLLERCDVAATVFVTSDYLSGAREFWWDELERMLLGSGTIPGRWRLHVAGEDFVFDADSAAGECRVDAAGHGGWSVARADDPTPAHRAYRELFTRLRPLGDEERRSALAKLASALGKSPAIRPTHRPLTTRELIKLANRDLVEIGGHTVTHPVLSQLSAEAQLREIRGCRATLESIVGRSVHAFSYPFGTRHDYTPATTELVREAGYRHACSNFPGLVSAGSDCFRLPRMLVRDWDGDTLLKRLRGERAVVGR